MEKQLCGIFSLKGIRGESQIKLIHESNEELTSNEIIQDTLYEKYPIMTDVNGELYTCNITHIHLMQTKKLPMMYVNVVLERPLRRILLLKITLFFTITSNITSAKQLLDDTLDGAYSLELTIDKTTSELDNHMQRFVGIKRFYEKMEKFTTQEAICEIISEQVKEIDEKLRLEYKNEFERLAVPQNVISLKDYKLD
jgi:hypothetical protein